MANKTIAERHADALTEAMELSRRRQDLAVETQRVDTEMLKCAGRIDLLAQLLAEQKGDGDGR